VERGVPPIVCRSEGLVFRQVESTSSLLCHSQEATDRLSMEAARASGRGRGLRRGLGSPAWPETNVP